jgi:hypothetical protein
MFTPPPSPLPPPLSSFHISNPPASSSSPSPPSSPQPFLTPRPALSSPPRKHGARRRRPSTSMTEQDRKRRIAWYTVSMVIIVPLVLALFTFSKRFPSRPLFLGLLAGPSPGPPVLLATRTGHSAAALHRRQNGASTMPSVIPSSSSGASLIFPSTASTPTTQGPSQGPSQTAVPTIPSSPPVLPTPFPQPYDTTLGNNFTTNSCETFFVNMTQSLPFRECRPFSFLSQTSDAFLQVSGSKAF